MMDREVEEWINSYYGISLKLSKIPYILDFTLLWNMFEGVVFSSKSIQTKHIETKIREILKENIKSKSIDESYNALKTSFCIIEQDNDIFLSFPGDDFKLKMNFNYDARYIEFGIKVRDILNKEIDETSLIDKVLALLLIAYRIRNNLFHGNKDIKSLFEQKRLFSIANQSLMFFWIYTRNTNHQKESINIFNLNRKLVTSTLNLASFEE